MDIVFGQLHLLMLGTELEAVPADTVSFEFCISSYLRASCVHSDRVCGLYSFIINVLLLFECRWSHSLQILLHVRNNCLAYIFERRSHKSTLLVICSNTPVQLQSDECVYAVPFISNKVSVDGLLTVEILCNGDVSIKI